MEKYTEEELEIIVRKAEKYDRLDKAIGEFYKYDDEGNPIDDDDFDGGLISIGELAAAHFGYL